MRYIQTNRSLLIEIVTRTKYIMLPIYDKLPSKKQLEPIND